MNNLNGFWVMYGTYRAFRWAVAVPGVLQQVCNASSAFVYQQRLTLNFSDIRFIVKHYILFLFPLIPPPTAVPYSGADAVPSIQWNKTKISSQEIFKWDRSAAKGLRPPSTGIFRRFDSFPKTTPLLPSQRATSCTPSSSNINSHNK